MWHLCSSNSSNNSSNNSNNNNNNNSDNKNNSKTRWYDLYKHVLDVCTTPTATTAATALDPGERRGDPWHTQPDTQDSKTTVTLITSVGKSRLASSGYFFVMHSTEFTQFIIASYSSQFFSKCWVPGLMFWSSAVLFIQYVVFFFFVCFSSLQLKVPQVHPGWQGLRQDLSNLWTGTDFII